MMKRIFTKFLAAVALLTFLVPLTGWGQSYSLYSGSLVEGDYLIVYSGKAMKNTISSNRLGYQEVTVSNNAITTTSADIVWHIAPSGDYWTIYNAAVNKYAAGNGTKNQAALLTSGTDDGSLWTASGTSTYEFVNKKNADANVNKNLRNNGTYGFACYATGTGGALSLYKLVETNDPSITANNITIDYNANSGSIAYTVNNPVDGGVLTANTTANWLTPGTVETESVAFTCDENEGAERSATVVLTYTYNTNQTVTKNVLVTQGANPNMPGTENNPYTVAQAIDAIDNNGNVTNVYATGIVSQIVTEYNSQYGNITFDMVDAVGDDDFLRAYRCGGTEAANVQVGDIIVVSGDLTYFTSQSLYEFSQGCQVVSIEHPVITDPYITADDVEITYDATSGSVTYAIENEPNPAGTLTANTTAEWLTIGTVGETVPFTCEANAVATSRTATVTLTYTYNRATTTKDVTVTQAGNPDVVNTISEITEVGTEYAVRGTVVATNNKGFVMGDGTGYVYYYKNATVSQSVGDMVKVSGTTGTYGQIIQFTNSAAVTEATTSNYNNTPAATVITEVPDYSTGYHLSTYFEFEGTLAKSGNNYLITLGENQIIQISYPTTEQGNAMTALDGKTVHVKGYFSGINSSSKFTVMLESVEEVLVPSVTVTPATINAPAEGADGSLAITYENIPDLISFDYYFCDAEGNELEGDGPEWIYAEINEGTEGNTVDYIIEENDGEARTAYFKVYTFVENGDDLEEVYAIVTVNQEEYVAPTYAELPFSFNGGRADIEDTDGLYQDGLGTDYNASTNPNTQLKFDGTGDWLMLQFNERPGTLTFDIKGNSFSGGTFMVQTSEDGTTYTDLQTYTSFGSDVESEEFSDLGENIRYIKWIYTNKGTGNVGLGNITLAAYEAPAPSITVNPDVVEVDANAHEGTLAITYANLEITDAEDFMVVFYDEAGAELTSDPEWIVVSVREQILSKSEDYEVSYVVEENEGEARTAYFKVVTLDEDFVYSNLVSVSQAAAPQQYTLTVEPFENLEIITFVNDEMVMEIAGEIQVNEGDHIMLSIVADEGYVMETLMVNGVNHVNDIADDFTYEFDMPAENVTISATASEIPTPVAGSWVLTSLADLTADDIFVIVGDNGDTYAMPYDGGGQNGAPAAVEVTVVEGTLSEEPAANIQWNLEITDDGYIFYPNGTTDTWLYCTNTNNGVRVGTNDNKVFYIDSESGYLVNDATSRYIGIYNSQDWRCYTNTTGNIANQTFAFYKKVEIVPTETYTLTINGYNDDDVKDGYNLIASPVYVNPANVEGMTEGIFDLYYFDQSQELEWQNYEFSTFNLVPGKGYLYAKKAETAEPYNFTLTGTPYTGDGEIELNYTEDAEWAGWNLVGNPFGNSAEISENYYEMNSDGFELIANEDFIVDAMQGVFVIAEDAESTVIFEEIESAQPSDPDAKVVLNVMKNRGNVIDRAVVRFGEGRQLPKFQLDPNSTKLYIPQGDQDFAVVRSANEGELSVNFKAETGGTYTLNVEANAEMTYLHLIDNLTGADVDLLANPSYSFEANSNDYASRFKLVFRASLGIEEYNATETFAYFNGSEWVISNTGDATLQVIDMMGRVLRSEEINGNTAVNINETAGIYMLRLVNGENVMVQKVVVK